LIGGYDPFNVAMRESVGVAYFGGLADTRCLEAPTGQHIHEDHHHSVTRLGAQASVPRLEELDGLD
jgi:hypothetical protein